VRASSMQGGRDTRGERGDAGTVHDMHDMHDMQDMRKHMRKHIATNALWVVSVVFFVVAASLAVRATAQGRGDGAYMLDTALITVAVLALSAYCCRMQGVEAQARAIEAFEAFDQQAPADAPASTQVTGAVLAAVGGSVGDIANALTVYVTSFSAASYAAGTGSKVWKNVAGGAGKKGPPSGTTCNADGTVRDLSFTFKIAPAFSPKTGFALGSNTLTGPYSHQLGISGDMAFSVFVLCQLTGDVSKQAVVFRMYANTINNNGCALVFHSAGPRQGGMIAVRATLQLGNGDPVECVLQQGGQGAGTAVLLLDPARRYLWAVTKDYGRLCVYMADVDSDACAPVRLLDTPLVSMPPLSFSNRDMTINDTAALKANLMCFGVYARCLVAQDVAALCGHYRALLRRFDPGYAALMSTLGEAAALKACPYDPRTCKACGGVLDWTDTTAVLAAGETCRKYIDRFCTATPQHPRCACWNSANPEYDASCRYYRTLFGGDTHKPKPEPEPEPKPEPPPLVPRKESESSSGSDSDSDRDKGRRDGHHTHHKHHKHHKHHRHHHHVRVATDTLDKCRRAPPPPTCGKKPPCPHKHKHDHSKCPHSHEQPPGDGDGKRLLTHTTFWDWLSDWK
jgi:hypothetical protein